MTIVVINCCQPRQCQAHSRLRW